MIVSPNTTLTVAVEKMNAAKVHRLVIVDEKHNIIGLLTQSNLISWLNQHVDELFKNPDATIEDLSLGIKTVKTCSNNDIAITVFQTLEGLHISALGVVDENGKLISSISASELRV